MARELDFYVYPRVLGQTNLLDSDNNRIEGYFTENPFILYEDDVVDITSEQYENGESGDYILAKNTKLTPNQQYSVLEMSAGTYAMASTSHIVMNASRASNVYYFGNSAENKYVHVHIVRVHEDDSNDYPQGEDAVPYDNEPQTPSDVVPTNGNYARDFFFDEITAGGNLEIMYYEFQKL